MESWKVEEGDLELILSILIKGILSLSDSILSFAVSYIIALIFIDLLTLTELKLCF